MSDSEDVPSTDDIRDAVAIDAADGIASVTIGDTSVTALDPMKRLDIADRIKRNAASSNAIGNILGNTKKLISGGAYD
jgi:hypothetical protein